MWNVGEPVEAYFDGHWWDAVVYAVEPDGRYVVQWLLDSTITSRMPARSLRKRAHGPSANPLNRPPVSLPPANDASSQRGAFNDSTEALLSPSSHRATVPSAPRQSQPPQPSPVFSDAATTSLYSATANTLPPRIESDASVPRRPVASQPHKTHEAAAVAGGSFAAAAAAGGAGSVDPPFVNLTESAQQVLRFDTVTHQDEGAAFSTIAPSARRRSDQRRRVLAKIKRKSVRALTGSKSDTPHYSLIKGLSAVQLKRGRFIAQFVEFEKGASVGFHTFTRLFRDIFALEDDDDDDDSNQQWHANRPTLVPSDDATVLQGRESALELLIERIFKFFDFDGDETISLDELMRFAQAPLAATKEASEAPKYTVEASGRRRAVPRWKRELWDEVVKETQGAMLRALGWTADTDAARALAQLWKGHPHIDVEQFEKDVEAANIGLSSRQKLIVFEVADSVGTVPLTLDTGLMLRYCTLNPDIGTESSFPITFTEHQHRKANDQIGLILYLPFIIMFTFFLITDKGLQSSIWVHEGMTDLFLREEFFPYTGSTSGAYFKKDFYDIGQREEFWEWVEGPLTAGFWSDDEGGNAVQYFNVPIGAIKFRQKRVAHTKSSRCSAQKHMFESNADTCAPVGTPSYAQRVDEFAESDCHPDWAEGSEETKPYSPFMQYGQVRSWVDKQGVNRTIDITEEPWRYRSCSELNGSISDSYLGKTDQFILGYDCGGFALTIPFDWRRTRVQNELQKLKQAGWIDRQTRAVIVTLITYNTNIRLFTRFEFAVEFAAGGALIPTSVTRPFRLFDWRAHDTAWAVFLIIYFITLFAFVLWFFKRVTNRVRRRMKKTGLNIGWALVRVFRENLWFLLDLVNYLVFMFAVSVRFEYMRRGLTSAAIVCTNSYPQEYDSLANLVHLLSILDATNALLTYSRVFYYLRLHNGINILIRTLEIALPDILNVIIICVVIFVAFGLCGHIVFGHVLVGYRDMFSTYSTMARALLGDFDYSEMRETRRIFAPMYMIAFTICCVIILFNLIIAILSEAYHRIKDRDWNPKEFRNKARHDPAVSLPPSSVRRLLESSSIWRDLLCATLRWHSKAHARRNLRTFWKDYLSLFHSLERGTPREMVYASVCLMQLELSADPRVSVVSSREEVVPVAVGLGGTAQHKVESVVSYLRREMCGWHTLVAYERMLIKIPCMQLELAESVLWDELLECHHHWRVRVSSYTRFDLPMEDRITDLHNLLCGGVGYDNGEWNKYSVCSRLQSLHHYAKGVARGGAGNVDVSSSSQESSTDDAGSSRGSQRRTGGRSTTRRGAGVNDMATIPLSRASAKEQVTYAYSPPHQQSPSSRGLLMPTGKLDL